MTKQKTLLLLNLIVALALSACSQATATPPPATAVVGPDSVVAEGHLVPQDDMYVMFAVRGKVAEVLVEKGQTVTAGTVLARLGDREQAEAAVSVAQLELTNSQQAYDNLVRTAELVHAQAYTKYLDAQTSRAAAEQAFDALDTKQLDDDIDTAEAEMKSREADLKDAQTEFDKYVDLDKDNATRVTAEDELTTAREAYNTSVRAWEALKQTRETREAALAATRAAEAEAKRTYETTAADAVSDALTLAKARLETAQAQAAAAQRALDNYDLKAPFDGLVTDINVTAGETVSTDRWAFQLADVEPWYVDTSDLTELEVVKISEGQAVKLVPDALPELELEGVVESISLNSKTQSGDVVYTVRIRVDNVDERLRWGMTFEATFAP